MVQQVNEAQFKEKVIGLQDVPDGEEGEKQWMFLGDRPAIVDFYADWCQPCKVLSPVLEELSEEYTGKIDFYKVNVDAEQVLAKSFQIQSIPSVLLISTEEDSVPQMILGAVPKEKLIEVIEKELGVTK